MRKYLAYLIAIVFLAVIVVIEIIGITTLERKPRTEPKVLGGGGGSQNQATSSEAADNDTGSGTTSATEPEKTPTVSDVGDKAPDRATPQERANYKYNVEGKIDIPGQGLVSQHWQEAWTITASTAAGQKKVTVDVTSNLPQDTPYTMNYTVKPDGTITGTFFTAAVAGRGNMECRGELPIYLPLNQNQAKVNMDCFFDGLPAFTLKGTATSKPPTTFTWSDKKQYQIRTLTIVTDSIAGPGSPPASLEISAAPGIGPTTFVGSIGDLIFHQIIGLTSSESMSRITAFDNDQIWRPE